MGRSDERMEYVYRSMERIMRFALFMTLGAGLFGQFVTIQSSDTPAGSLTQLNKKMASQVNAGVPGGACTAGLDFALNSLTNGVYICPAGSWVLYAPPAGTVTNAMLAGSIDLTAKVTGVLPNANTTAASANTASAIVARDGSGNFVAGTITAALTGNVTGNVTGTSGSATGNAATATALAANPADCAANNFATTIAANGDLICAQPSISAGVSGLAANVATALATPSSANLLAALTDETGTGAAVFATSPTLVTPLLGTPTSGVATNLTGLPLATGVIGTLLVGNGGTGATTAAAARTSLGVTRILTLNNFGGFNPVDSTTYYFAWTNAGLLTTESSSTKLYVPNAGTITKLIVSNINTATAGTNEAVTITLRLNGVDTAITGTMTWDASTSAVTTAVFTGSVAVAEGDLWSIKAVTPNFATNPIGTRQLAQIVVLE